MAMTNQEVCDRISDAVRDVRVVFTPQDHVIIFCEDKGNERPGKKYLFYIELHLQHYKGLFESDGGIHIPVIPL